jgi:hypothetical protein
VTARPFNPELPIDRPVRPVRRLASITGNEGGANVVPADALLQAGHVVDALRAAGRDEIHIDFDTLGPAGEPRADQLGELVQALQRDGIRVHGVFTLGQDHDGPDCFERLVAWVEARGLADVELRLWTPDPGDELIRELARADRIRHRDLQRWDGAHVVVTPAHMSAQTLYRGWVWARRRLSSLGSRWRRRPTKLAALPGYLLDVCWAALAPLRARARAREQQLLGPVDARAAVSGITRM